MSESRKSLPTSSSRSTTPKHQKSNPSTSFPIKSTDIILPQTRVRAIMKSSPEVEVVGNDALHIITKSTELFVQYMAHKAFEDSKGSKNVDYKNLAEVVRREDNLEFLKDIIPAKITGRMALHEYAKQKGVHQKELMD